MEKFIRNAAKTLALLTALLLIISVVPLGARAAGATDISANGLEFIKLYEDFSEEAVWDYSQWSIGYGNYCGSNRSAPDKSVTLSDGTVINTSGKISEEQASLLFKDKIKTYVGYVNDFAKKYNRSYTQNEFDALVSFTYNMGNGWMSNSNYNITKFMSGVKSYSTDSGKNELSETFTDWCHAGGAVLAGLYARRQFEAALFLTPANTSYEVWETSEIMNFRKETSTSSGKYCTLDAGTRLVIMETTTANGYTWGKTRYYCDGKSCVGWVALYLSKKLTQFKAITATTTTTIAATTAEPTTYRELIYPFELSETCGDANGDGKVTAADVLILRKYLASWSVEPIKEYADVNSDGKITAADVLMIRKHLARWRVGY